MLNVEQHISPLVENMFPSFYKEEGPNFITFVKAYYEWLENSTQSLVLESLLGFDVGDTVTQTLDSGVTVTGTIVSVDSTTNTIIVAPSNLERFRCITICGVNHPIDSSSGNTTLIIESSPGGVIYQSRNLAHYRDIDSTIDRFILNFKEKYLKNIQFDTATNKKLLVKNSLDLYRSKGTQRSIDLFFKLIYGVEAEVYYPGDDLFKLSDGEWVRPRYLEVTDTIKSIDYVGKQIVGTLSGSTAFCERLIKRRVKDAVVSVLYISNVQGEFNNDEPIGIETEALSVDAPRVVGSLTSLEVVTGSRLFSVGDIVRFTSTKGDSALARVASITNTTGVVDFELIDGGWGYTSSANVYVSEKVLELSNVVTTNTEYFDIFEYVKQPAANIQFDVANATFANGDGVFSYYSNGTVRGSGSIITTDQVSGEANGYMYITVYSGTFPEGANVYTTSNTKVANVFNYVDQTARGFVVGIDTTANVFVTGATGVIGSNVEIYQGNSTTEWANAYIVQTSLVGSTYVLQVGNLNGAFRRGSNVSIRDSAITGNVSYVDLSIGLFDITGSFSNTAGLYTYGETIGSNASVSSISGGFGATFNVGSLSETEDILLNIDILGANNGKPPATDAYTDSFRRIMAVASETGFTNTAVVYQEYSKIAFNPSTVVNATSGFITLPTANTKYMPGDTLRYTVAAGNTVINDLISGDEYYVYASNTSGVILSRRYDNLTVNSTNFPNFANNLVSQTGHFLSKMAYGIVTNTSVGSITTSGAFNGFSVSGGSPSTTVYANGNIVLYSAPTTNTTISSISTAAAINVSNQSYMSLPLIGYAYGFPKNIQGNIQDVIFSCLTIDQFTLGSIATLTGINPGADYTVDPYVLVYQPYIPSYERRDYIIELSGASSDFRAGERIQQTPVELTYYTLAVTNSAPFFLGEQLYQGTSSSPTATMIITDIFSNTSMRVNNVTGTIANSTVYSYATANSTTISDNDIQAVLTSADGIVKDGSNTSVLKVKRIQFNNTFEVGETITGVTSGSTATIADIYEDASVIQIGLNANVIANVVTANGTVTALQVTDSGFGYSNSDIITYTSEDGDNSGLAKAIVRGVGTGSGYYKSSKGFVSQDKYIIDSDFYQEYSYEVLSKLPFDKYAEMFKKVMHTAGTKVFGSVVLIEADSVPVNVAEDASEVRFKFNSNSDIASNSIDVTVPRQLVTFNSVSDIVSNTIIVTDNPAAKPNMFSNGDMVLYYTNATTLGGLANNTVYYVTDTTTNSIRLTNVSGGAGYTLTATPTYETHYLQRYDTLFANGDVVRYSTNASYGQVQTNIVDTFVTNTGIVTDYFIKVANNLHLVGDAVNTTFSHTPITANVDSSNSLISNSYLKITTSNPYSDGDLVVYYTGPGNTAFVGLSNNTPYYIIQSNSSHVRLATQQGNTNSVVSIRGAYNNETGHFFLKGMSGLTSGRTYYVVQSNTSGIILSKKVDRQYVVSFNSETAVSNTNDTIALTTANTYFANGDFIKYYTGKGVPALTGLANNQYYYVRHANTTTIKLSDTATGTIVNVTSATIGSDSHYLINDYVAPFRSSNTGVTVTLTQTLLTNNGIYYCVNTVPTTVQLARSVNGTAINITANGTHSGAATNGHYLTTHV
jgi:hypothetical protein